MACNQVGKGILIVTKNRGFITYRFLLTGELT